MYTLNKYTVIIFNVDGTDCYEYVRDEGTGHSERIRSAIELIHSQHGALSYSVTTTYIYDWTGTRA